MSSGNVYTVLSALGFPGICGSVSSRPVQVEHKIWSGADRLNKDDHSPHPYTMSYYRKDEGLCENTDFSRQDTVAACFGFGGISPVIWDNNDELKLLGKLASKIRDHNFNAAIFGGTAHQTVRLIADRAQKLAAGLTALKKGRNPEQVLAALGVKNPKANQPFTPPGGGKPIYGLNAGLKTRTSDPNAKYGKVWLEASYGWTPLVQDIYEGAQALAKHVGGGNSKIEFRARTKKESTSVLPNSNLYSEGYHKIQGQIIYVFERLEDLPTELEQIGIYNPATLAWELLPWSFVIDWVLPVGSFLENLTMVPFLKGSWCKTYTTRSSILSYPTPTSGYKPVRTARYDSVNVVRTVGTGGFTVPFPNFKSPLSPSWMRAANAIALLTQFKR